MKAFVEKNQRTVDGKKHVQVTMTEPAPTPENPDAVASITCLITEDEVPKFKAGEKF